MLNNKEKFQMKKQMRERSRIYSNESGFSIAEVIVVVGIIGILAVAGIGTFMQSKPTRNLHAEARDLLSNVQLMRLEAVKRGVCIGMELINKNGIQAWR